MEYGVRTEGLSHGHLMDHGIEDSYMPYRDKPRVPFPLNFFALRATCPRKGFSGATLTIQQAGMNRGSSESPGREGTQLDESPGLYSFWLYIEQWAMSTISELVQDHYLLSFLFLNC